MFLSFETKPLQPIQTFINRILVTQHAHKARVKSRLSDRKLGLPAPKCANTLEHAGMRSHRYDMSSHEIVKVLTREFKALL